MKADNLDITEIRVFPLKDSLSNLKANAKVVLNECLVLSGLKIVKGQFGHYLAYPNQSPGSPWKYYDTSSMSFRKKMQNSVLQEYAKALAASIPSAN
jgi:DNA-binding cell septation regulator SpoVG